MDIALLVIAFIVTFWGGFILGCDITKDKHDSQKTEGGGE